MTDKPPIVLRTTSLEDFTIRNLLQQGFEKVAENKYVKYDGGTRILMERVEGGWVSTLDMLVGVHVLDIDPELLE